ncbi:hypothetical protein JCM11251_001593 [Rhodosporidiobolus azoricus]
MSAPPPPRRTAPATPSASSSSASTPDTDQSGWKGKMKGWGMKALDKSIVISDKIGVHANKLSSQFGGEAFWPVSGDFPTEVEKCIRILRAFTVDGVAQKVIKGDSNDVDGKGKALKKQVKVFQKIPAEVLREAKGVIIYASNRMGTAPFGGSGGSGLILARLPDGSWSAPSAIAPGNFAAGLMFGIDLFEAVLVIRTEEAMKTFYNHTVTLGAEVGVAAGAYGAGAIGEAGKERAGVYSYVRSRGFYVGAEAIAQAWFARFDENERVYGCTGIKQEDILKGHFRPTYEALPLIQALKDAETGVAQRLHGAEYEFEQPFATKDAGLPEDRVAQDGNATPMSGDVQQPALGYAEPLATTSGAPVKADEKKELSVEEREREQALQAAFYSQLGPPPALPARNPPPPAVP